MSGKRFLFVMNRYLPAKSGAENLASQIAEKLVLAGHSVDVFAFDSLTDADYERKSSSLEREETINKVRVKRFPLTRLLYHNRVMNLLEKNNMLKNYTGRRGLFSAKMVNALQRHANDYDVIFAGVMPFTGVIYPALKTAKKFNKKFILLPLIHFGQISDKSDMKNFNKKAIRPEMFRYEYFSDEAMNIYDSSDIIITQGRFEENFIKQNFKSHFARVNPKIAIPEETETFSKSGFTLSTFANHNYEKGIETTLNAFRLVKREAHDAKLIIAGSLSGKYKSIADAIGGVECVGFLNENEKSRLLFESDIFILPSIAESLGIATIEAHSHGVPTINAFCSGSMQIVKHGYNGFLVSFQDYLLTYKYIMSLYNDRKLLERMKKSARESALGRNDEIEGYSGGGFGAERQEKQIKSFLELL